MAVAVGVEHHDVLIVGAGLSGIGAACRLRQRCPEKSFTILEARDAIGGTWDLFRYPGIRSDSDMFTLGYSFAPWLEAKAIADGPAIREYIRRTARERGVDAAVRYRHRVIGAEWSSSESRWTVTVARGGDGETVSMSCDFLFVCSGYYDYEEPHAPSFKGAERYQGELVHPQHWPQELDYAGKRVIVIGSGATAVTLVPALADVAAHVTMVQRSPSYVVSLPVRDPLAVLLRRVLPARLVYPAVRIKNVAVMTLVFQLSRRAPGAMRRLVRRGVRRRLPPGYAVDTHFNPRYDPWDQRLCLVPNGDLFKAISDGRASIVTDEIETFTERGLRVRSGEELQADVIITATGLNLRVLGGIRIVIDGVEIDPADTVAYKGMMFSGIPNLAVTLGYTNASWTLKCDLVTEYVCRLLRHMDDHGYRRCVPLEPRASLQREPLLDLRSGYVLRARGRLPKQGSRPPWRLHQNYARDVWLMRHGDLDDEGIAFSAGSCEGVRESPLAAVLDAGGGFETTMSLGGADAQS